MHAVGLSSSDISDCEVAFPGKYIMRPKAKVLPVPRPRGSVYSAQMEASSSSHYMPSSLSAPSTAGSPATAGSSLGAVTKAHPPPAPSVAKAPAQVESARSSDVSEDSYQENSIGKILKKKRYALMKKNRSLAAARAAERSRSSGRRAGPRPPVDTAEPISLPMDHIVIVAGVSPSNCDCVSRLHLHALVVGTATRRCDVKQILTASRESKTSPATAGHWLMTRAGNEIAADIGESCRFLFTAVRETHWLCPPEMLWQSRWYDKDHLEYAVIMRYTATQPMLGIGKQLRLMLCLCGEKCSRERFRKTAATYKLEEFGVHAIVVLANEENTMTTHRRPHGVISDGTPSLDVESALMQDGVYYERHAAGGSDMYVLGKQQVPNEDQAMITLPHVQAKQWKDVTTFWVGKARGGRSDAARAKRAAKAQNKGRPYEHQHRRIPQQLLRREYRRDSDESPDL